MKSMKLFFMAWVVFSLPLSSLAQTAPGAYTPVAINEGVPTTPTYLQEHNVKYSKRVIREIDPRQKVNKGLMWPRNPFGMVLYNAIMSNGLLPYANEMLSEVMTDSAFFVAHQTCEMVQIMPDVDDPYYLIDTLICTQHTGEEVYKKFWVVEDWVFDYERSVLEPRIIAIAPIHYPVIAGVSLGPQPLYWVKMDDLRPHIAKQEMFTTENKVSRLTFDDFFQLRLFDSHIVKQTNVYDWYIRDFDEFKDDGISALLESEEIDNGFFVLESDFWQY